MPLVQHMHYIHFISLLYGLFIVIRYEKITWTETIRTYSEFEKL